MKIDLLFLHITAVTEMISNPKSLIQLSCLAAARENKLTGAILTQPDYREICHRVLPKDQQIKLFSEYRKYSDDGMLVMKQIYNGSFVVLNYLYYVDGRAGYTYWGGDTHHIFDSLISVDFRSTGDIARINIQNVDAGFELHIQRYVDSFEYWHTVGNQTSQILHGLHRHVQYTNPLKDMYKLYEYGDLVCTLRNDLALD